MFLLIAVCLPFSQALLDFNLALRLVSFHVLAFVLLLAPGVRVSGVGWWLMAYYAFILLSAFWSISPAEAIMDAQRVLVCVLTFTITGAVLRWGSEKFLAQAILVVCALVLLVNSVGFVIELFTETPFVTTSAHRNLLASLLFLFVPLLLHSQPLFSRNHLRFAVLLLVWIVVMILFLKTRSVWLASAIFIGLVLLHRLGMKPRTLILSGFGAAFALSALLVIASGDQWLNIDSVQERVFIWQKTAALIADHPWIGVGGGNWSLNYTAYGVGGFETLEIFGLRMQRPHNDFLWVLAEGGMIGMLLIGGFFAHLGWRWWKSQSRSRTYGLMAGAVAFVSILLFSFPRERVEHIVLFFILLAWIDFSLNADKKHVGSWMRIPLLLLCGVAIATSFFRLRGDYFARQLLEAVNQDRHEQVLELAEKAESPFYQLISGDIPIASYTARAHQRLGHQEAFMERSKKAYEQAPHHYEVMSNYGMTLNAQKRYNEAREVLLEAYRINPRFDATIFNLAIVHYNLKDYRAAKMWIDRVHFKSEMTDYYSGLIHRRLQTDS